MWQNVWFMVILAEFQITLRLFCRIIVHHRNVLEKAENEASLNDIYL